MISLDPLRVSPHTINIMSPNYTGHTRLVCVCVCVGGGGGGGGLSDCMQWLEIFMTRQLVL